MLPKDIFQKHKHIGLDLDETLASTFAGMLRVAHDMGKLTQCKSIDDFFIHDICQDPYFDITQEESHAIWYAYGLQTQSPSDTPVEIGSQEGVEMLMQLGIHCSIITARNGNDMMKRTRSENWVAYHFPRIALSDLHFVNHYSDGSVSKSVVCKDLGITLLIDDHIDNARDMVEAGLSVILLEKPWNRDIIYDHPNLYRVKNWQEIIDNLSSK